MLNSGFGIKGRMKRSAKQPTLMLTSLLDMFTIILIFLIVSFEAEDYDFKLNPDLKLPQSTAHSVFKEAISIDITRQELLLQKKKIYELQNGMAKQEDFDAGEISALVNVLKKYYSAIHEPPAEDAATEPAGEDFEEEDERGIILIQADKRLNYKTLYLVMKSAAKAGFFKYRLVIMKK